MIKRVRQYIDEHCLLDKDKPLLVAVSGGADSVALLDILCCLGYRCIVLHCNFHLRGDESDRDEAFVRNLVENLQLPLYVKHFSTQQVAKEQHISIEMAARNLRYQWFEECRRLYGCQAIAVAHHQNDQAETMLLNIKRGTGIRGLAGMLPRNGFIVRPLLGVQRKDILLYLKQRNLSFVEDSTNKDTRFKRNAIRQQLESCSSADIQHFANTCEYIQGYLQLIEDTIFSIKKKVTSSDEQELRIHIPTLLRYPYSKTILFELLRPYGFLDVEPIYASLYRKAGKQFRSSQFIALKDREYLFIYPENHTSSSVLSFSVTLRHIAPNESFPKATEKRCFLDKRVLNTTLQLRHWKAGDFFFPLGMKGRKKVSDFLTDLKLSLKQKEDVFVLASGEDIVWVIGYRIDERYKVTDTSEQIAEISITAPVL